jgi:hypothetical protein
MVIRTRDHRQMFLPVVHDRVQLNPRDTQEVFMVKRKEAFPSKWLVAVDLNGGSAVATIKVAAVEAMKDFYGADTQKVVAYFTSKFKPLPLNRVNYDSIADIAGTDETDDWQGTKVELFVRKETVKGVPTDCVRVRKPGTPAKAKAKKGSDTPPDFNDKVPY